MYLPVAVERWGRVMLRGGRETRERERRKSFDLTLHRNTDQVGFAMHYMSLKLYCISLTTSRLAESTTYLHCKYHSTVLLSNSTTSKQDLLWLRKKSHHCDFSLRGTATQKTSRDRGAYPLELRSCARSCSTIRPATMGKKSSKTETKTAASLSNFLLSAADDQDSQLDDIFANSVS